LDGDALKLLTKFKMKLNPHNHTMHWIRRAEPLKLVPFFVSNVALQRHHTLFTCDGYVTIAAKNNQRRRSIRMNSARDPKELIAAAAELAPKLYFWRIATNTHSMTMSQRPPAGIEPSDVEKAEALAERQLKDSVVKKQVCGALKSVSNDLSEITKIVATALISLSTAGVITLPMTPLAFAAAGLVVFRSGVAAYCPDQETT